VRRNLLAGAVAGLCGAFVFALLHAMLIVPIWLRSGRGFLWGAAVGTVAGWSYAELGFDRSDEDARGGVLPQLAAGATFGGLLWLAVTPVTIADALLRALGVAPRYEILEICMAIALAIAGGLLLGWYRRQSRRAALAAASATTLLAVAMAGPVPIGRSLRAAGIFLAVLPAALLGGTVVAALSWSFRRRRLPVGGLRRPVAPPQNAA
jgi:hypothetical protein